MLHAAQWALHPLQASVSQLLKARNTQAIAAARPHCIDPLTCQHLRLATYGQCSEVGLSGVVQPSSADLQMHAENPTQMFDAINAVSTN